MMGQPVVEIKLTVDYSKSVFIFTNQKSLVDQGLGYRFKICSPNIGLVGHFHCFFAILGELNFIFVLRPVLVENGRL